MRSYIKQFMVDFEYPTEAAECLLSAYDHFQEKAKVEFDALISTYESDSNCDYDALIKQVDALSLPCGVHTYTAQLLLFICFSRKAKELYLAKGIDEQIWHDSMLDLKWKLFECKEVYDIWGSFVANWFPRFFIPDRFALGRLQFEIIPYEWTPYEKNGVSIQKGDKVINVHIPRTGTGIRREVLDDAYARAAEFFKDEFKDKPVVFVCNTWLLYPGNKEFIPEKSNLRAFMENYDIVKFRDDPKRGWLWRLFDTMEQNPDRLPADTSLRRAYINRIKAGGLTGSGSGVYIYQK